MPIQPYLCFEGRCEEAIEFYTQSLGAKVLTLLRFADSPDPFPRGTVPSGWEHKVLHASMRISDATVMASDGCSPGQPVFEGFSLSLAVRDKDEAGRTFPALAEGGQVKLPLAKTFWSPQFGMVTDRFGVSWMIHVDA